MERFLNWFAKHFPCLTIKGDCYEQYGPYLDRYFLLGYKSYLSWKFRASVYLHRIWRSDNERHIHDHPWNFVSIILSGSYTEHTMFNHNWYGAGSILLRPAEWQHRLVLERPVWTLVIVMNKRRSWGFNVDNKFVHNDDYTYFGDC